MGISSASLWLSHYGLREQPFGVTPNPRYLFLSPTHAEALASLMYGVEAGRGFMALIAQPGMGKTTLLFQLLERLRPSARTVFLFQTQCDSAGLMHTLLGDLGIETAGEDLARMYQRLNEVLSEEARVGRRVVLVIDEAQNLEDSALETVRMMSNFETPSAKLMQIILAGQPQLGQKLAHPNLAQLRQRVSILARLVPFNLAETNQYLDYRLKVAGYSGGSLFTTEAREIIATRSHGIPRNINNLGFNALSLGYALDKKKIDASVLQEVLQDLDVTSLPLDASSQGQPSAAVSFEPVSEGRGPFVSNRLTGSGHVRRMSWRATALAAMGIAGGTYLTFSVWTSNIRPRVRSRGNPVQAPAQAGAGGGAPVGRLTPSEPAALEPRVAGSESKQIETNHRFSRTPDIVAKSKGNGAPRPKPSGAELSVDSTRIKTAIAEGDAYLERGEYDSAIRAYGNGLAADPASEDLHSRIERAKSAKAAEAKYIN